MSKRDGLSHNFTHPTSTLYYNIMWTVCRDSVHLPLSEHYRNFLFPKCWALSCAHGYFSGRQINQQNNNALSGKKTIIVLSLSRPIHSHHPHQTGCCLDGRETLIITCRAARQHQIQRNDDVIALMTCGWLREVVYAHIVGWCLWLWYQRQNNDGSPVAICARKSGVSHFSRAHSLCCSLISLRKLLS